MAFAPRLLMRYDGAMFKSHAEILELWIQAPRPTQRESWFLVCALDLRSELADLGINVTYYRVRRWWERQSIPPEYYAAVVKAAKKRGFNGVTADVLSDLRIPRMEVA